MKSVRSPFVAGLGLVAFASLFGVPECPAAPVDDAIARVSTVAEEAVRGDDTPGLQLAVASHGELLWSAGFGFADLETPREVDDQTRFGIGSITKTLTMVLCARLVQEGLLDWDAPVEDVLPDFPHAGRGVTLRRIGAHLSGMGDAGIAGLRLSMEHFETDDAYLLTVTPPLVHEPGARHLYATGTFNVVAAMVEHVTGESFPRAMQEYVLDPLALEDTVVNDPHRADPRRTSFYEPDASGALQGVHFDPSHKLAGAGYLSTAADLVKLGSAFFDPDFLDPSQRETLFTDHRTTDGEPTGFGLGWRRTEDAGERILLQPGGGPGISCYLVIDPQREFVCASLTNATGAPAGGPVLTELIGAFREAVDADTQPSRRMAITLDDLPQNTRLRTPEFLDHINASLLRALAAYDVRAVGFVNTKKCYADGDLLLDQRKRLKAWIDEGHELGNHTWSHPDYRRLEFDDFVTDVERGEPLLREILVDTPLRWFRHPYLHRGETDAKREALEHYLHERGYREAAVSIDNAEWVFAFAYERALTNEDQERADRIADAYLDYMIDVVRYWEGQSQQLFARNIDHVLLLHANALNADHLDALLGEVQELGYEFISLDQALADPAYRSEDRYSGRAGISWLHRWALTREVDRAMFAGEPRVPDWVENAD